MARQTRNSLKPMDDVDGHNFGRMHWHPKKPAKKICYRDMDLGWLQNVIRWLGRKREEYSAESNAAASYGGSGDEACSMAEWAADSYARRAANTADHIELIERYVLWREENGYVFHAPKPAKRVRPRLDERARESVDR